MRGLRRQDLASVWLALAVAVSFVILFTPGSDARYPLPVGTDKVIHALTFGFLGAAAYVRFWSRQRLVSVIIVAYAVASEFIQKWWIPGREFDAFDMVADTVGMLLALWLIHTVAKRFMMKQYDGSKA